MLVGVQLRQVCFNFSLCRSLASNGQSCPAGSILKYMSLAAMVALDVFLVRLYYLRTKRRTIETSISFGEAMYQLKWEFLAEFVICNLQPIPVSALINHFGARWVLFHFAPVCLVKSVM